MDVRKGQSPGKLERGDFLARFRNLFWDPVFEKFANELSSIGEVAWQAHAEGRKSPVTQKAGPDFADPDYDLSVEWLAARRAIAAAEKRWRDRTTQRRVLLICASPRTDDTCPGEMSKTYRLAMAAKDRLAADCEVDFLDLSRITNGKLELVIAPVDLNETVRHICGICRPEMEARGTVLNVQLDESAGLIMADAARLHQVLWNVLKNAVKFTPREGAITITTERLSEDRCAVRVTDSGIGIAPDMLPRVFDAFEQGGAAVTRRFGGLGLGLAISKAIVERHGGSIRAESDGLGYGATFIVELPGKIPFAPVDSSVIDAAGTDHSENTEPQPLKLLLVEDHADTARTLSRQLTAAGFMVDTASDVATAISAAKSRPFDVLVTDVGLPDGTGYDVLNSVHTLCPAPAIVLSGYGLEEDRRRSRQAGFAEHLVKPVRVAKLIEAIRRVGASQFH